MISLSGWQEQRQYLLGQKLTRSLKIDPNNCSWFNIDRLLDRTINIEQLEGYKYGSEVEGYIWQILGNKLGSKLGSQLNSEVRKQLKEQLKHPLNNLLDRKQESIQWRNSVIEALKSYLNGQKENYNQDELWLFEFLYSLPFYINDWVRDCCWFDFCISVLKCSHAPKMVFITKSSFRMRLVLFIRSNLSSMRPTNSIFIV